MDPNLESGKANLALEMADRALHSGNRTRARHLAFLATRLDPTNEHSWLILAATASPRARLFYLNKVLEMYPQLEAAQNELRLAAEQLDRVNLAITTPAEISLKIDSAGEIPSPVVVHSWPQNKNHQFMGWVKKATSSPSNFKSSALYRVMNYTAVRMLTLCMMIFISIFLIVYIANLGGYLDTIQKGLIEEGINGMLAGGWLRGAPQEERQATIEQTRQSMQAFYGLNQSLAVRSLDWLYRGITFNWGESRFSYPISSTIVNNVHSRYIDSNDIRTIIAAYLPRTLLLLGSSNLGIFLVSILISLTLARKPNTKSNQLIRLLSLTSSIPSWVFGLVLLAFFYFVVGNYSLGLGFGDWPTNFSLESVIKILKGLFLPFLAIFLSKFFQSVYAWRTYFLIYSKEDYIELARAKGLPDNVLERRYLLRPALPSIITSLALLMISIWQECIAVEYFFNVGGIGGLFVRALNNNDLMIVIALVATFAFFLALTVLFLDVTYAIVDPRVRIEKEKYSENSLRQKSRLNFSFIFKHKHKPFLAASELSRTQLVEPERIKKNLALTDRLKFISPRITDWRHSISVTLREFTHFPTAVAGMVIIAILSSIAIFTVVTIPYYKAISLWRGDDKAWIRNPKKVPPEWTNAFRSEKLPVTIDLTSRDISINKIVTPNTNGTTDVSISFPFDYANNIFPQDILVLFSTDIKIKNPFVTMTWVTPDGREIPIKKFAVSDDSFNLFSADIDIKRSFAGIVPVEALFKKPGVVPNEVLNGRYELKINGILFEEGNQLDAELVVYGQVYGLAGTDLNRRDLSLILSWGLVVALAFGIIAAIGTTLSSVLLAAAGAWFGGWIDGLIQRISEIIMVLPILPTSIMIFFLYSKSIWVILGVTIALSIFGNSIKNYRAMFLQVMETPYIEAARSYGASSWRVIFQYMIPRMRSVLIPQLIILIPSYVFFESTLAFLGVSDPVTPTLGKLMYETLNNGIFNEPAYLTLEPFGLLLLICLGFAFLGFALERFFNEKLGI